jgi:hypothetical protein
VIGAEHDGRDEEGDWKHEEGETDRDKQQNSDQPILEGTLPDQGQWGDGQDQRNCHELHAQDEPPNKDPAFRVKIGCKFLFEPSPFHHA